jgi:hypothetical protein
MPQGGIGNHEILFAIAHGECLRATPILKRRPQDIACWYGERVDLGAANGEASDTRASLGRKMILVAPGIRPAGSESADQKRTMRPAAAIAAGADYLVVGRPVTQARNPREVAEAIIAEIAAAMSWNA